MSAGPGIQEGALNGSPACQIWHSLAGLGSLLHIVSALDWPQRVLQGLDLACEMGVGRGGAGGVSLVMLGFGCTVLLASL